MLVKFRIDPPCMSVAFVSMLVLGIVLVMSPSAEAAVLPEGGWLLPAVSGLLIGVRTGEKSAR